MLRFDPLRDRESYLRNGSALIAFYTNTTFNADKPMGNIAASRLRAAVECWLIGLNVEIARLLPAALNWLDYAIATDEKLREIQNFHRMTLHVARAMAKWMSNGDADLEDWRSAWSTGTAAWSEGSPATAKEIVTHGLDDFMAYCVQSRDYEEGIRVFEHYAGNKSLALSKALLPRRLGYAICLHHARRQYDEEDLFQAGRRMLRSKLSEDWLSRGQSLTAAMWLKIVYWDRDARAGRQPTLTPLQTILKAYENMPGVAVPDFIKLN